MLSAACSTSNESEVQVEELESRLNAVLAENKALASKLDKANAKVAAQKRGESDEAKLEKIGEYIDGLHGDEDKEKCLTPTQKAVRQAQTEFCYKVRAFHTDVYSAATQLDGMKDFDKEDRDGCIEFMERIIKYCNEIIAFWKEI